MRDARLPTPRPYGFAEITPEREYLIVMEFFEGARELRDAEVDDRVIDDALRVVRRMWDAGVAHRDVKPSNILVRDGKVLLIDVAFAAVRPTPWRQAVDLANMMLTLALASTPEHVYQRALNVFAAEDVAEAFAACRSITIPGQLRSLMREDGRHLTGRFRQLAPARRPIPVQLWDVRRAAVTAGLIAALGAAVVLFAIYLEVAGLL
jgi:serine/threonine protein kinase